MQCKNTLKTPKYLFFYQNFGRIHVSGWIRMIKSCSTATNVPGGTRDLARPWHAARGWTEQWAPTHTRAWSGISASVMEASNTRDLAESPAAWSHPWKMYTNRIHTQCMALLGTSKLKTSFESGWQGRKWWRKQIKHGLPQIPRLLSLLLCVCYRGCIKLALWY